MRKRAKKQGAIGERRAGVDVHVVDPTGDGRVARTLVGHGPLHEHRLPGLRRCRGGGRGDGEVCRVRGNLNHGRRAAKIVGLIELEDGIAAVGIDDQVIGPADAVWKRFGDGGGVGSPGLQTAVDRLGAQSNGRRRTESRRGGKVIGIGPGAVRRGGRADVVDRV